MPIYSKDSLETLRQRVDLIDVITPHVEMKRAGAAYKACCPFHDEKTPSFTIRRGDTHYHCFGCGAHGDAIQFLMSYSKMSFHEAVESLAQRFNVHLEVVEGSEESKGPAKADMRTALEQACDLFHFMLLHTDEGHEALRYLYGRGIDLDFIRQFRVGLAPKQGGILRKTLHQKYVRDEVMVEAGLLKINDKGGYRDFFYDRITFPICNVSGAVIGFSARKYREETFGGKYVNTPETPLFKKSQVLYGLNFSRRRIAKERKAIVVEGQIDALRLIKAGINMTVAGQGTAFGEGHVRALTQLGVNVVYLALDSDDAGEEAACKIGDLFQKEGVEVLIVKMPHGSDPDAYLNEHGPEGFLSLLDDTVDYLTFLVEHHSKGKNMDSPAAKNEVVQTITTIIRQWDHPLMVHESLRKLAHLTHVPENIVGVGQEHVSNVFIKKQASIGLQSIDPNRVIECDFLRWLLLMGNSDPQFIETAQLNLADDALQVSVCRHIYRTFLDTYGQHHSCDLLTLVSHLDDAEGQLVLSEILQKKVNKDRAAEDFVDSIQKILNRNWMEKREAIKMKIQGGQCSDDEALELVKEFDNLKRQPPVVQLPESVEATT
ncbi:MAG: DNA primase [Chlamydiia bacterium]|nr:DNA primase [Chlamydiia bacterium]